MQLLQVELFSYKSKGYEQRELPESQFSPSVNFPVIVYKFETKRKLDESLAASLGNHKASQ